MKDIKRKRLLKVLRIIRGTDESHPINCNEISQILYDEHGIVSDRQVILADIKALRDDGYDIESCEYKRRGYYMASHLLDDWQLKVLIDAINNAQFITSKVAKEIINTLLATTSKGNASLMAKATPLINDATSTNIIEVVKKGTQYNISSLLQSIFDEKRVSFNYCSISKDLKYMPRHNGKEYVVNPYLLYWDQDYYYLCASEMDALDKLKTYRLDRIDKLKLLSDSLTSAEKALGPEYESILQNHVNNSIHHFGGDKRILLQVKVPDFMIDYIFDEFGESLISIKTDGDMNIATIHANYNAGLKYLLLQYSENLEVVGPDYFRGEYIEMLKNIVKKYE